MEHRVKSLLEEGTENAKGGGICTMSYTNLLGHLWDISMSQNLRDIPGTSMGHITEHVTEQVRYVGNRRSLLETVLNPLVESELLKRTISEKPKSRFQKYVAAKRNKKGVE